MAGRPLGSPCRGFFHGLDPFETGLPTKEGKARPLRAVQHLLNFISDSIMAVSSVESHLKMLGCRKPLVC